MEEVRIDIRQAYGILILVTLEHLKLFKDIVQTRSISRGAQLNGISQSAASQHLGRWNVSTESVCWIAARAR